METWRRGYEVDAAAVDFDDEKTGCGSRGCAGERCLSAEQSGFRDPGNEAAGERGPKRGPRRGCDEWAAGAGREVADAVEREWFDGHGEVSPALIWHF